MAGRWPEPFWKEVRFLVVCSQLRGTGHFSVHCQIQATLFRTCLSIYEFLRDAVCEGEGTQDDEERKAAQDGIICRQLVQPLVAVY